MSIPNTFQLDAFQDAVYSWVKNVMDGKISEDRIVWRDQGAPIPRRPCVTLKITDGPRDVGRDGSRFNQASGNTVVGVQSEVTVSVQIFGQPTNHLKRKMNAAQCALDLNSSLMLNENRIPLRQAGLAVQERGDVLNISALEETQFEERYQFDVKFGVARNAIDNVGVIENVNGQGTVGTKTVPIKVTS